MDKRGRRPPLRRHILPASSAAIFILVLAGGYSTWRHGPPGRAAVSSRPGVGASGLHDRAGRPVTVPAVDFPGREAAPPTTPAHETGATASSEVRDLGVPDDYINGLLATCDRRRVREAQDKAMSTWPPYREVRGQYRQELAAARPFEHLSRRELVQAARERRRTFWARGGDLAAHSYPEAYRARVLLEYAHERFPGDLGIIDELVETIQTTDLILRFDKTKNRGVPDERVRQELLSLRGEQFRRVEDQIRQGRAPTLQDFVCGCDLAYLLQAGHPSASRQIVAWLRTTDDGTWRQYEELLRLWEGYLERAVCFGFGLYQVPPDQAHAEYRYERRLPSFRGPSERRAVFWPADTVTTTQTVESPPRW